jgi:glutamate/tyrosine decarboxylase-like PLP-dependent enzyme
MEPEDSPSPELDFLLSVARLCSEIRSPSETTRITPNPSALLPASFPTTPSATPLPPSDLIPLLQALVPSLTLPAHRHFHNQLFSQGALASLGGEWVAAALNTSMATAETAAGLAVLEDAVLRGLRVDVVGMAQGEATMAPGGSLGLLLALSAGRNWRFPEVRERGMAGALGGRSMVVFCSSHAHYSVDKMACVLGIGAANVVRVPVDAEGRMDCEALEQSIVRCREQDNNIPFCVVATSGTTVLGAFDDLEAVADIAARHSMWMHVDAAYGGPAVFSSDPATRGLVAGLARADSIVFNFHKILNVHQQCTAVIFRHPGCLKAAHAQNASYLFQPDRANASMDTGDGHLMCARRPDILKLFLAWNAVGRDGFGVIVDRCLLLARYLRTQIEARGPAHGQKTGRGHFELIDPDHPGQWVNVCFWYIPSWLKHERGARLGAITANIKKAMVEEGTLMVSHNPLDSRPNFFRFVAVKPENDTKDMDFVLDTIERIGEKTK